KEVSITCYVDADHARDKVSRRSVTGIIILLNNTPVSWLSKRQKTDESSTYGSELVASRIAAEMIISMRYFLTMLGVNLEPSSYLVGDNMAVVLNTTIPSSSLKKKHQACNYHKVRESIAAGFIKYGHIRSEDNVADLLTKPLGRASFEKLTSKYLFRRPKTVTVKIGNVDDKPP
ncbi:MAG TPA: Ty1/Copia family ribonuclease HI, partial [Phormidium sp.]